MISRLKGNNKQISPTAKYKPVTPFVPVENWMRFPHRRLSTASQQSNFRCNLRARFPQDGPGSISFTCRSNIQLIFNCPFYYLSVKKRRNPILGIGPHRQATVNINVSCLAPPSLESRRLWLIGQRSPGLSAGRRLCTAVVRSHKGFATFFTAENASSLLGLRE